MSQVKHPLTSNVYLKALLQTSKKNDLKLAQEKALTKQQLESVEKKMPTLLTGKQELANRLHQKRSHSSVFIPDYGYLDSADLINHNPRDIIRDINAQKYINQVLQQRQELVPKVDYLTEAEKQALIKERENLPFAQHQLLKQLVDNNTNDNAQLAQALERIYNQQEQNNQLQTENAKFDNLIKLLNPEGKKLVLEQIKAYGEHHNVDVNDPAVMKIFNATLQKNISNPNFRKYLAQYSDEQRQQEIRDLLRQQYETSLRNQTGPVTYSSIVSGTTPSSGASGSTPTTTPLRPFSGASGYTPTTTTTPTRGASGYTPSTTTTQDNFLEGIDRNDVIFTKLNDNMVRGFDNAFINGLNNYRTKQLFDYLNIPFLPREKIGLRHAKIIQKMDKMFPDRKDNIRK